MVDQASGLRQRVQKRSEATWRATGRPLHDAPTTPLITAHVRLLGCEAVRIPSGSLLWHWRLMHRAATGWDLQARLHVCGLPHQFSATELSQWRYLTDEWHLLGESPELLAVADRVMLWLPSGGLDAPSLLPKLRQRLAWLCRNRPDLPIILAGTTAVIGRRLTRWAFGVDPRRDRPTRAIAQDRLLVQHEEGQEPIALRRRMGYYRLLQMCRDYPAQTDW